MLLYSQELEGTRGMCKACNHIFTISSKPQASPASSDGSFPFECPSCHHLFEGKAGMLGKRGKCDQCGSVFEIQPAKPKIIPASVTPEKGSSSSAHAVASSAPSPKGRHKDARSALAKSGSQKNKDELGPVSGGGNAAVQPSVWDTLELPNATTQTGWEMTSSWGGASFGGGATQSPGAGLFARSFKLAQKNLVMATLMMLVTYILSSLAMMFLVAIPVFILIFLGDLLAVRMWPRYAVLIFLIVSTIPMFAVLFYTLPGYWNIALRAVRGKELGLDAASEQSHLAPQFLGWTILASLAPGLICAVVSVFFFALIFGAASAQSPALLFGVILLFYAVVIFAYFLAATPFMLAPFALIDGYSLIDAISLSIRLSVRHAGAFYLLTFVAMLIGSAVSFLSCGVLSTFAMTFVLMNHAAFYKLTSRSIP
jgi:hypothetical protein